jgi:hypothetical protein
MKDFKFLSGIEEPTFIERLGELNLLMESRGIHYHEMVARLLESANELNQEIERIQSQD